MTRRPDPAQEGQPVKAAYRTSLTTGVLELQVQESPVFPLDDLCGFAARNNRKRGFLFLSKVLGKHWPATPSRMRLIHEYLAAQLRLGAGPLAVLAMAETATGLGQGLFEALLERRGTSDVIFVHSTRYRFDERPYLTFQEHHCHAPDQYLHTPIEPRHLELFDSARELILVDDEISTGSTLCNLVDAYRARNPGVERAHFVSITNFSGAGSAARFSERLQLPVECVAALHADFTFAPAPSAFTQDAPPAVGSSRRKPWRIAEDFGRFGIDRRIDIPAGDIETLSRGLDAGARILVLGTGEYMHLAFRVGLHLEEQGFDIAVQSTTRSPILLDADVVRKLVFADNYGEGINNYLYNVDPNEFARIIICHETPVEQMAGLLDTLGPNCLTYRSPATGEKASTSRFDRIGNPLT